jgi:predicted dithiol-disulfide oxidoreductase (DUF899 family)
VPDDATTQFPGEPRHVDLIWSIWNVLDMTPGGRGDAPDFPAMQYE